MKYASFVMSFVLFIAYCASFSSPIKQNSSRIQTDPDPEYKSLIIDLEQTIPKIMAEVKIPGLSIALVNDAGIIWLGHFGVESVGSKARIDDSTVFIAASFSKVVFSYLVLKMVDEGKLALDVPLIHYAPRSYIDKAFKKIKDRRFYNITARMVLTHSSGFADWRIFGRSVKIHFQPGSEFSYSGEAFVLLQKIVEYIESEPIEHIVREKVFIPLEMHDSSYVYEKRFKDRLAKGHGKMFGFLINMFMLRNKRAHAERSLLTTTEDFAKFLISLMSGSGLKTGTFHDMLSPQINAGSEHVFWGLGLGIENHNDKPTYWHDGEGLIFENYFAFQGSEIGFVYFSNSANGLSVGEEIAKKVIPGYHPSFRWLGIEQYNSTNRKILEIVSTQGLNEAADYYFELKKKDPQLINEFTLNSVGYSLLKAKKIKAAIRIFELNAQEYPASSNVYDSLGEAYLKNGTRDLAIKNYEKSLELNPENSDAKSALKKLRR